MNRRHLRIIEVFVWVVGIYLVVCLVTVAARDCFVRTTDHRVTPPRIISDTPRAPWESDEHLIRLLPSFPPNWHEQEEMGMGPMNAYSTVMMRVDTWRTLRWCLGILAVTAISGLALHKVGRIMPEPPQPRGFDIQTNP